jgi:hypothetical protein
MSIIKVKDEKDVVKDSVSGAILNVDNQALSAYKKRKLSEIHSRKKTKQLEEDINTIKSRMDNIESLLIRLIEKESN